MSQALGQRQARQRQMRLQQQDAQLQNALHTEALVTDMLALRMNIGFVRANSQPNYSPGTSPEVVQQFADDECQNHKKGERVTTVFDDKLWVC